MDTPQALHGYEQRLRALGAPVLGHLRPGLTNTELDDIEREYGFPLPHTARVLWGWHDGTDPEPSTSGQPSLVPHGTFNDLRSALDYTRQWRETLDFLHDEAPDAAWQPRWLVAIGDQYPTVLDCTSTTARDTPALRYASDEGVLGGFRLHFVRWVQWWTWAIDHSAWTLNEQGGWVTHPDRMPSGPGIPALL